MVTVTNEYENKFKHRKITNYIRMDIENEFFLAILLEGTIIRANVICYMILMAHFLLNEFLFVVPYLSLSQYMWSAAPRCFSLNIIAYNHRSHTHTLTHKCIYSKSVQSHNVIFSELLEKNKCKKKIVSNGEVLKMSYNLRGHTLYTTNGSKQFKHV